MKFGWWRVTKDFFPDVYKKSCEKWWIFSKKGQKQNFSINSTDWADFISQMIIKWNEWLGIQLINCFQSR
jgi:hypothetical protein